MRVARVFFVFFCEMCSGQGENLKSIFFCVVVAALVECRVFRYARRTRGKSQINFVFITSVALDSTLASKAILLIVFLYTSKK